MFNSINFSQGQHLCAIFCLLQQLYLLDAPNNQFVLQFSLIGFPFIVASLNQKVASSNSPILSPSYVSLQSSLTSLDCHKNPFPNYPN